MDTNANTNKEVFKRREFDLLALGEILLRLSPPVNERLTRGDVFQKQAGRGIKCGVRNFAVRFKNRNYFTGSSK